MSTTPTPSQLPRVRLAALRSPQGVIELEDGSEHQVFPVTGEAFHLLNNLGSTPGEQVSGLYDAVHCCVPSLTREQLLRLTMDQAHGVIQMASGQVSEVLAVTAPNAAGTTGKRRRPSS